jgi:hypothetical protein
MRTEKDYEVVFAEGTRHETRYPERAVSKDAAKEAFCQEYLGRYDGTFLKLLKVYQVSDEVTNVLEIGDRVTCYWCKREFAISDPIAQQIGEGIYWDRCTEEKES